MSMNMKNTGREDKEERTRHRVWNVIVWEGDTLHARHRPHLEQGVMRKKDEDDNDDDIILIFSHLDKRVDLSF